MAAGLAGAPTRTSAAHLGQLRDDCALAPSTLRAGLSGDSESRPTMLNPPCNLPWPLHGSGGPAATSQLLFPSGALPGWSVHSRVPRSLEGKP